MMGSRWTSSILLFSLLHVFHSTAQSLSSCPSTSSLVTNSNGNQFQICPDTDFQAPSFNIINQVTSASACAQLCQSTSNCKKAVYDDVHSICHIKGNPGAAPWVTNSQYTAVYFLKTIADGTSISADCPTQETLINNPDGSQTRICPMSDYQTGSTNVINSVSDATACASLCLKTQGCTKAVYDRLYSICHIKGNPTNAPWVVNLKQYDSVRIIPAGSRSSTSSSLKPTSTSIIAQITTKTTTKTTSTTTTTKTNTTTKTTTTSSVTTKVTTTTRATTTTAQPTNGLPTACPSNPTTFTAGDGSVYEICPKTDYQGPSTQILPNVSSAKDCAQICNNNPDCKRAVFDAKYSACHLKDGSAIWVASDQFDSIRFLNKTSTPVNNGLGSWSAIIRMPVIPVAAYVVPAQPVSNRILMFSSWSPDKFSGATGITQFADFNWQTNAVSQRTITNTQHDMFCPGISSLQDGRIAITGGENAEVTSFYDPQTDSFVKGPNMNLPRGYQSSATTSNGGIFTIGGSFSGGIGGKTGEILDPSGKTWTVLPGADVNALLTTDAAGPWRTDNHAWLYGWKDGTVFQAGPSKRQHWYDTKGRGAVAEAAIRDPDHDAMCGVNVMYDAVAGKILSSGGSQDYTDSDAFSKTHITTIGTPFRGSQVEQVAPMALPRGFANIVVLPDGTSLVTGGMQRSLVFSDYNAVYEAELFNPVTKTWRTLARAKVPRNYHSVSILLADGTVFAAGGGMCPTAQGQDDSWCNRSVDHMDAEIFSPPYLFNADGSVATRPVISGLSSSTSATGITVNVGGTVTVNMNDASGTTFALVRIGSSTHSINTDQRRVPLTNVVKTQARYTIQLPNDSGIVIPGYYYLFALSNTGVPSIARTIQVKV